MKIITWLRTCLFGTKPETILKNIQDKVGQPPLCVQCCHFRKQSNWLMGGTDICLHENSRTEIPDLTYGSSGVEIGYIPANWARASENLCGRDGKWWEMKE